MSVNDVTATAVAILPVAIVGGASMKMVEGLHYGKKKKKKKKGDKLFKW